ncbi:ribosomal protein L4/L1 family-domain-containing protein [Zychaea mexicana]|uniref:ribosomal protein L4/L1 family-domain-containing protein n=1 Tax=Zychaea mexicana TaxID=64656 RepID=UPI0022FDE2D4|nr:ribosomal protein L4/L1 family-domain-containing protein [Zychaea mexicana]KAI9472869.1 ribosomal protein L4/L1 family-domain-containing protein [Zychaea mexicana]
MSFMKPISLASANVAKITVQKRALATATNITPQVSPFPKHVEAFVRDFKTSEPLSIMNLDREVFGAPLRRDILQRVVIWQRDGMRQGTHSAKGRSEVAGTGKKAAPQKGRGKARVGDMKAPHFRGGGAAFGPKPRDHSTELPRKVQVLGLRVALSTKYAQDQLTVVDSLDVLDSKKTREFNHILTQTHGNDDEPSTMLIVTNDFNENLELAARNIPRCEVIYVEETNVLDLLTYDKVVIEKSAVETLESVLGSA